MDRGVAVVLTAAASPLVITSYLGRHPQAVAWMAVDRHVGGAAGHQRADDDGEVLPVQVARRQLRHQRGVGRQAARDHHHPGGVLVQAMHDAGARHLGKLGVEMQ